MKFLVSVFSLYLLFLVSCKRELPEVPSPVQVKAPVLPQNTFSYTVFLPHYAETDILGMDNTPIDNFITDDGATLGRVLFYDKSLSYNKTISCGSCHKQSIHFADDRILSQGFMGGHTRRHSMSLGYVRYYPREKMFWDERATTLEAQVLMPIQDAIEMGMDVDSLKVRLENTFYYPPLFEKAFGTSSISSERIAKALAQFIRSMNSWNTRYDSVKSGLSQFSSSEERGEKLFTGELTGVNQPCSFCHSTAGFISPNLMQGFTDSFDTGVGGITGKPEDMGKFKSPSLRGIMLTAPYMHNGSIPTIDSLLKSHEVLGAPLTKENLEAVKDFLSTLTDRKLCSDEKWSNPFR